MGSGPVIFGFDGTPPAEHALREGAALLAPRPALVVVVWEAGRAFELMELPIRTLEAPATSLDVRTAFELDRAMYEQAERLAQQGATVARELGMEAEGLAVADDVTVAETLLRLARELDSQALVAGAHGHSRLREALLGSTTRDLLRHAPCPVVVVREEKDEQG